MARRTSTREAGPSATDGAWEAFVADLHAVARRVGLLGACTPVDASVERARLLAAFERHEPRAPAWEYPPAPEALPVLIGALAKARERLDVVAPSRPLHALTQARIDELLLELEAVGSVGTVRFGPLCRVRFGPFGASADDARADLLADGYLAGAPSPDLTPVVLSDDSDPASLLSRLRAEVARRKLPFSVCTSQSLSALAAISGDTLWVAEGRRLSRADVERTVVHEIEAHALPRTRALASGVGLLTLGTARGADDQEGYALWLEERRGVSGPLRRRELGARHVAVRLMRCGADFVTVVRLLRDREIPLDAALRVAERAFRGSDGMREGLGRERVYLEAFVRVHERLEARPEDEAVLGAGQVSVAAIEVVRDALALTPRRTGS